MYKKMPDSVTKYFWGDDLVSLNWSDHKSYIIKTLLEKGDKDSISWLLQHTNKQELNKLLSLIKLSPKSANFWSQYLS